jgi:hypothetical protein
MNKIKKIFNAKVVALGLFIGLLAFAFFRSQSDPTEEGPGPASVFEVKEEEANEFKDIVPGKSSEKELESKLGPLMDRSTFGEGLVLQKYTWIGKRFPAEVVVDGSGVVKYMRIPVFSDQPITVDEYVKLHSLGKPDLEMFTAREYMQKVFVFLSKGVALEPSNISGEIFNIRYFEPTDVNSFLNTWGKDLVEEYEPRGH